MGSVGGTSRKQCLFLGKYSSERSELRLKQCSRARKILKAIATILVFIMKVIIGHGMVLSRGDI